MRCSSAHPRLSWGGTLKPLSFDDIVGLEERELERCYPRGIVKSRGKFRAALKGEKADHTLAGLKKEKRRRRARDVPNLLGRSGGYTRDPRGALGKKGHYAGEPEVGGQEPEPEGVDEVTLKRFSAEAASQFDQHQRLSNLEGMAKDDAKRVAARFRAFVVWSVRCGIDPMLTLARIEQIIREAEEEMKDAA